MTSGAFRPQRQDLPKDLSADVTVALVSIAQDMAEASRRGEAWISGNHTG